MFISCDMLGYRSRQNRSGAGLCFALFGFGKIFFQQCQYFRIGFCVSLVGLNQLPKAIEHNRAYRIDNGQQKNCPLLRLSYRTVCGEASDNANDNSNQGDDEHNVSNNLNLMV